MPISPSASERMASYSLHGIVPPSALEIFFFVRTCACSPLSRDRLICLSMCSFYHIQGLPAHIFPVRCCHNKNGTAIDLIQGYGQRGFCADQSGPELSPSSRAAALPPCALQKTPPRSVGTACGVYGGQHRRPAAPARHTAKKIRSAGGRLKGPPKRRPEQDTAFRNKLTEILTRGHITW